MKIRTIEMGNVAAAAIKFWLYWYVKNGIVSGQSRTTATAANKICMVITIIKLSGSVKILSEFDVRMYKRGKSDTLGYYQKKVVDVMQNRIVSLNLND